MRVMSSLPQTEPIRKWRRADVAACIVLLLAVITVRAPWIGNANADVDEQLYSLIGNAMLEGKLPFVDLWDRKPVGLFALFALAHAVGGPAAASYQVLAGLFTLAGAVMMYVLSRVLVDRVAASGAGLLYVVLMSTYGSHSGQSEAFYVPMMLAMALLVRDPAHPRAFRRALAAMLIGGFALQVKYTVVPQCIFFGMWALWGQYKRGAPVSKLWRSGIAFAALGLLPTIAVGAFYTGIGHFDAFLFANFTSFFDRLPSPSGRLDIDHTAFVSPLVVLIVLGGYAAIRLSPPRERQTYIFMLFWLVASLATVFLPATVYRYYYAALVPNAILVALPLIDCRTKVRWIPLAIVLAGAASTLFLPQQYAQSQEQSATLNRLSRAIAPNVDNKTKCLWVFDGPTSLYTLSGSCLPTRYIYPDHLNNALERNALGVEQTDEVARILANRPPIIVTADTKFTIQNEDAGQLVERAVTDHYRELTNGVLHGRTIRVWKRID